MAAKGSNWFSIPVIQDGKLSTFSAEVLHPVEIDGKPMVRVEFRSGDSSTIVQAIWPLEAMEALGTMIPTMLERI